MSASQQHLVKWIEAFAADIEAHKEYLTQLDSAIGDGDHGINMARGMRAARSKLGGLDDPDIGKLLKTVGMALVSSVGGAGGPLYGTLFMQMGSKLSGAEELSLENWTEALEAGVNGVRARGKAEVGDKTMLDALAPAVDALKGAINEGATLPEALKRSAAAAEEGVASTIPLVARKGRASYLGERSAGHQDPGATSSHLLLESAASTLVNG
jgi:phosphoenolpyruvate---glycerone phosphotransferase subunit DhaL